MHGPRTTAEDAEDAATCRTAASRIPAISTCRQCNFFFAWPAAAGGRMTVRAAVSARSWLVETPDGHPSGWYRKKSRRMRVLGMRVLGMRPRLPKTDRTPVLK